MPEIIPNWHPAAVHFPIALTMTATLLLLAGWLFPATTLLPSCGRLLLQLSALSAVVAAALGWYAFQTVDHDAAGHLVMLNHRAWAVASTGGLLFRALGHLAPTGCKRPPCGFAGGHVRTLRQPGLHRLAGWRDGLPARCRRFVRRLRQSGCGCRSGTASPVREVTSGSVVTCCHPR